MTSSLKQSMTSFKAVAKSKNKKFMALNMSIVMKSYYVAFCHEEFLANINDIIWGNLV